MEPKTPASQSNTGAAADRYVAALDRFAAAIAELRATLSRLGAVRLAPDVDRKIAETLDRSAHTFSVGAKAFDGLLAQGRLIESAVQKLKARPTE
ncbi:MAG: hypothetical protein ACREQI_05195 [Candidatus Binataceae bacterium]